MLKRRSNINLDENLDEELLINSLSKQEDAESLSEDDFEDEGSGKVKTKSKVIISILGVLAGICIITLFSFRYFLNATTEQEKAKEEYKQTQIQEPHSSLRYYLLNETSSDTLEAAALLIGHTMETGCSNSYGSLLEMFPDSSLEQLYPYLKGKTCVEYATANVVRVKENDYFYDYLIKVDRTNKDFIIKINHEKFNPTEFTITPFTFD